MDWEGEMSEIDKKAKNSQKQTKQPKSQNSSPAKASPYTRFAPS
jgi:hypothetical protein